MYDARALCGAVRSAQVTYTAAALTGAAQRVGVRSSVENERQAGVWQARWAGRLGCGSGSVDGRAGCLKWPASCGELAGWRAPVAGLNSPFNARRRSPQRLWHASAWTTRDSFTLCCDRCVPARPLNSEARCCLPSHRLWPALVLQQSSLLIVCLCKPDVEYWHLSRRRVVFSVAATSKGVSALLEFQRLCRAV